jgi:hypothetical protein
MATTHAAATDPASAVAAASSANYEFRETSTFEVAAL